MRHHSANNMLKPYSEIMIDLNFESAFVKIQDSKEFEINALKREASKHLEKDFQRVYLISTQAVLMYMYSIFKRWSALPLAKLSRYMDTRFIYAISNICQRLFSAAGLSLNDHPIDMLPSKFGTQLCLHVTFFIWDVDDFQRIGASHLTSSKCNEKISGISELSENGILAFQLKFGNFSSCTSL